VASLFFVSFALACTGSRIGYVWPWALSALALLAAGWAGAAARGRITPLAVLVYGFAGWTAIHTLLVSPAYTPAGLYHPLLLALAFAVFSHFDDMAERRMALAALIGGAMLALWGLVQVGVLGTARAHAFFETPATYAAVLNLMLVPILALALVRPSGPRALLVGILFAGGLFASASRGGLLALAAGVATAAILAHRSGQLQQRRILVAVSVLVAGLLLAGGLRSLPVASGPREAPPNERLQAESSRSRLELYGASWHAWQERPLAGTGYLTFRYVLERERGRVPSYGETSETWFVHNDFLQTLQELGPVGLAGLIALAWLPALLAHRRLRAVPAAEHPIVVAAVSATTAMAFHALVDFPFYVPACLLLYGALLGALDRRLAAAPVSGASPVVRTPWARAVRAGVAVIAAALLLRPVLAEAAAEWGLQRYGAQQAQSAAFWLETARRLDPSDWRYHMYAGLFWDGMASTSGSKDAARYANAAFTAGVEANPLEVRNLLGLISVHRVHAKLLDAPADRATREAWVARAEALAPYNAAVRRERALLESAR
jgi:O-antigen ligase